MPRIIAISSAVAHGHVGLSAAQPVLGALGHEVTALPTVLLSNHPGWSHVAGQRTAPADLSKMIDAIEANGWLPDHAAFLSGYLPSPDHVDVAAGLVARLRAAAPGIRIVVDPILGDAPKGLYIAEDAAIALRDRLVPLADTLTPNLFELGWLTGKPVETLEAALTAAQTLRDIAGATIHVTSPPLTDTETGVLSVGPSGATLYRTPMLEEIPNGVGDTFSALIAAGESPGAALGRLQALARMSRGRGHLAIIPATGWSSAAPIAGEPL